MEQARCTTRAACSSVEWSVDHCIAISLDQHLADMLLGGIVAADSGKQDEVQSSVGSLVQLRAQNVKRRCSSRNPLAECCWLDLIELGLCGVRRPMTDDCCVVELVPQYCRLSYVLQHQCHQVDRAALDSVHAWLWISVGGHGRSFRYQVAGATAEIVDALVVALKETRAEVNQVSDTGSNHSRLVEEQGPYEFLDAKYASSSRDQPH
jgi:hypothetical protein